jgi:O-antigen ligase
MFGYINLNYKKLAIIFPIFLISAFPISLLIGTAISNIFVGLIVFFLFLNLIKEKNLEIFNDKIFYLLLYFWFFLIFILFFSIDISNSISRTFSFIFFVFFAYSIKYFINYKNNKYLKYILFIWSTIIFTVALDCIYEYFIGQNFIGNKSGFHGRISSFLGKELKIGHFFLGFAPLIIAYIYSRGKFNKDNLLIILFLIFNIISFIIGERSNFIRFFFSTLFFLILTYKIKTKKIIFIIFIFLSVILSIIYSNDYYKTRFLPSEIQEKSKIINYLKSTQYAAHYDTAIKIFLNHPLTGIGLKNFYLECQDIRYINTNLAANNLRCSTHPHQHHLEILSSIGIFGYLFFIFIFGYFLIISFESILKKKKLNSTSVLFIYCFFSFNACSNWKFFYKLGCINFLA